MRRYFLALLLVVAVGFTVSAQQSIRVACVGNSITEGSRLKDPKTESWPAVLQKLLGDRYTVENFGISARTLLNNGDRPYTKEQKFTDSQEFLPDIVIIKLGTNDSKPQNWDQYGVEFEGDLREMVNTYKNLASNPKIYLCFPIWVNKNGYKIRESIIAAEIIPAIDNVAKETAVSVIDLHTTLYGMAQLLPDGVHPNALGAAFIAKDIYNRIR